MGWRHQSKCFRARLLLGACGPRNKARPDPARPEPRPRRRIVDMLAWRHWTKVSPESRRVRSATASSPRCLAERRRRRPYGRRSSARSRRRCCGRLLHSGLPPRDRSRPTFAQNRVARRLRPPCDWPPTLLQPQGRRCIATGADGSFSPIDGIAGWRKGRGWWANPEWSQADHRHRLRLRARSDGRTVDRRRCSSKAAW